MAPPNLRRSIGFLRKNWTEEGAQAGVCQGIPCRRRGTCQAVSRETCSEPGKEQLVARGETLLGSQALPKNSLSTEARACQHIWRMERIFAAS